MTLSPNHFSVRKFRLLAARTVWLLLPLTVLAEDIAVDVPPDSSVDIRNDSGSRWYFTTGPTQGATMARVSSSGIGTYTWPLPGTFGPDPLSQSGNRLWPGEILRITVPNLPNGNAVEIPYTTSPDPEAPVFTIRATVNSQPHVVSMVLLDGNPVGAASEVRWGVTFSEPIANVTAANFALVNPQAIAGASITDVSGEDEDWVVTARIGAGVGLVGCNYIGTVVETPEVLPSFTGFIYQVQEFPSVLRQPVGGVTILDNQSYTFTAEGRMPSGSDVAYEWYQNGVFIPGSRNSTTPSTDDSFTVSNLSVGTHTFFCRILSRHNESIFIDSETVTITVESSILPGPPELASPRAENLTRTDGRLGAQVTSDRSVPVTARGVLYAPTSAGASLTLGAPGVNQVDHPVAELGSFGLTVPLAADTEYTFVAFAINAEGVAYTEPLTFDTIFEVPVVGNPFVNAIERESAAFNARVLDNGGTAVQTNGFLFAPASAGDLLMERGNPGVTEITSVQTANDFSAVAGGLTAGTEYRVVAFSENVAGTGYSPDVQSFSTAEPQSLVVATTIEALDPYDQVTSLRDAVAHAAELGGPQTITFDPTVFGGPQTIRLKHRNVSLEGDLTVAGPGADLLTLDGQNQTGIFETFSGTVQVSGLTLANGRSWTGGSYYNEGGAVSLTDCVIRDSSATGRTGNKGQGGAVFNRDGTMTLTRCTLTGNFAQNEGGAVFIAGSGSVILRDSTITGNVSNAEGGGIGLFSGTVLIDQCTIVDNNQQGIYNFGGEVTIGRSLVAGNAPEDVFSIGNTGPLVTSLGHNHIGQTGLGIGWVASDTLNTATDPLLAPLGSYGGPSPTRPPLPGSPLIGQIPAGTTGVPATDQRGVARDPAQPTDIGAIHTSGYALSVIAGDGQTALASAEFSDPLSVRLAPNHPDDPVDGTPIAFTAPSAGPGAALGLSSAAISGGTASVAASANTEPGTYQITASVPTVGSVAFSLTNIDPALIPVVDPPTVGGVTTTAAAINASVATDPSAPVIERGILLAPTAVNPNPAPGGAGVVAVLDPPAGAGAFTVNLAGLAPGITYSVVAFATNSQWTTLSTPVVTFATPPVPPVVATAPATGVSLDSARLEGTVDAFGLPTEVRFQLATDGLFTPTEASVFASGYVGVSDVLVNEAGDILVADRNTGSLRIFTPDGTLQETLTGFGAIHGLALDPAGNLFVAESTQVLRVAPDGTRTTLASGLNGASGLALATDGTVFVAETSIGAVRRIAPDGTLGFVGGSFGQPNDVALDAAGNLYVSDTLDGAIKRVSPEGVVSVFAAGFDRVHGLALGPDGVIYASDEDADRVMQVHPDGTIVDLGSGWLEPSGLFLDPVGNLWVADSLNGRIVRLAPPSVAADPANLSGSGATPVASSLSGLSEGTEYFFRVLASGPGGTVVGDTESFTTLTRQAPSFASADGVTFTPGVAGSFTVSALGLPVPTLSLGGTLPAGVSFDPATGLLSGTPLAGTTGAYPLTLTATNGIAPEAVQAFTLTVADTPSLTVTTAGDTVDNLDGETSLREAIAFANSGNAGANPVITFAPALTASGDAVITLTQAGDTGNGPSAFGITVEVTLVGPTGDHGITLEADAPGDLRHFLVHGSGGLTLENLTLSGGRAADYGGAIWSFGSLTVRGSTFSGNHAGQEGGAIQAWGGAPRLVVENATITGNSADGTASAISTGAIESRFHSVTMVDNTAPATGATLWIFETALEMTNSIIARNTNDGAQTFGTGTFGPGSAHNLLGAGTWPGLTDGTDGNQLGVADPLLATLQDNGGPTATVLPLADSQAVNAGTATGAPATDQRGALRPQFGVTDIGAVELRPFDTGQTIVETGGALWYLGPDGSGTDLPIFRGMAGETPVEVGGAAVRLGLALDGTVLVQNRSGDVFSRPGSNTGIGTGWQEQVIAVTAGDNATWFLGPDGDDPFIYRWATDGEPTFSDGAAIHLGALADGSILARNSSGGAYLRLGSQAGLGSYWALVNESLVTWRTLHGLSWDGTQDWDNPSHDGVENLIKYAFNMATEANALDRADISVLPPRGTAGLPRFFVDRQGRLGVEFVRRRAVSIPGITYLVETAGSLSDFAPLDLAGATVEIIDSRWERVTAVDPVQTATRFGRVRVTVTSP